jgi:uncharacterized repeat protein (TIGR01451 family)
MKSKSFIFCFLAFTVLLASVSFAIYPPANFKAIANARVQTVILRWDAVKDAVAYNVYRKEATDAAYRKINIAPVTSLQYKDRNVILGGDYLYVVRSVFADGTESADSIAIGAPSMVVNTTATITTLRDKPLTARSIRDRRIKTFAGPGDVITYRISYANNGFSAAKNVKINYRIPEGTKLAGTPLVKRGAKALISYFDKVSKKWVSEVEREENVGMVSFLIKNAIPPVRVNRVNGIIDLNVTIEL